MASPSTETPITTNSVSYSSEPKTPSFSSSPPPDVTTKHDVFLSFHGKDTRYKFTSHLYEKLTAYGIKTYKDDPDLRIGEVISDALIKAIHDSKIYIVVFSENYAYSPWCLDECVEIYKCYQEMNRLVVGVYCGIDPSVVRYQNKSFAEAFTKHKSGHFKDQLDKVNEWGVNLQKVSDFSGKHLSAERSEADIINEILDRIRLEINPNTLDIAKHPVGLESRVEDIKKLLEESTEKGGITKIGIYGMRGVGKTTLAKSLYNHLIKESFKDSCFLADVRGYSEENLKLLQKQLINDIVKSNKVSEVSSVHHGMKLIEDMIRLTKVLVVIDDLDQQIQFDSLVRKFASGSVVIITTTDEELLRKIIVEPTHRYKVNELKGAEEVTLFNLHAFGDAEPSKELVKLSQDVLPHADGLPLALAVFGSHLFNNSEEGWNAFIKQLKEYPVHDVNKKLVISYDALKLVGPMLQDFFLDIACFFIGWEKERVVKIMETFYNSSNHYINVLKQRCLLTINNKNQLGMHDLIVMMGKDIVRNISHKEPEKHSRLWMSEEIWNVLEKKKGTKEIEGIIPSNFYEKEALEGVSLATNTFKMMSKLRFLYLKTVNLTGSFEQTLEDVRWLHWDWCPLQYFPSDFKPEKLAILELPHSKMRTIWEPNMVPKAFETLTTIDMSYSLDLTATPDFTKLPCLVTLNFKGCESLEKIHIPDGSLGRLIILNLRGCVKLKSLSDNISKLRALKSLNIGGCISLTGSPTELNAWGQPVLKLPMSIGLLSKSVELNTSDNEFLDTPSTSPATRWDVFLSFSGIDTRHDSFTAHLYHGLDAAGIRTFRRDPMLATGDLIPRAIEESKICVVILSENYASSALRLEELATILDCNYTHGRMVLPVFYHINPLAVQYQSGSFGKALKRHEKLFDKEKVDKWRLALREVAKFSGYWISEASPEPEIIQDILFRAKPKTLEDVAKYPVGLETRVKGIINVLNMSSGTEGVTRIGIYGMGGVGKTTLAKALYNKLLLLGSFEDSCFLENVREVSHRRSGVGLIALQQKLINDVLKYRTEITIHSVDQGIKIMRDRMRYRKVLVVVDDLDNYKNYYSLVGPLIGSGSVVIITTRDQDILINKLKVDPRYQFLVKELNDAESVALFARHAFPNAEWNESLLEAYSQDILELAGGLPLALAVYGSLFAQSGDEWKAHIERLQKIPEPKIQLTLKTSFVALECLDPDLQNIFLDIACFFVGRKREEVVMIMESYYSNVGMHIDSLKKRCLLTINTKDELGMHNLLQIMGREIVRNNCHEEPEKHSRLWSSNNICDVLNQKKGTAHIEGIVDSNSDNQDALKRLSFKMDTFSRMSKLRFLHIKYVKLKGKFENTLQKLTWLCWDFCPLKNLPSDFYLQKLVILDLPHSNLQRMWKLDMVSQVFGSLKTLNMKYSQELIATPDFKIFPNLETLNLEGCQSLLEIHISIGTLTMLVSLNMGSCRELKSLPDSICDLSTLEVLNIDNCSRLEALPTELGSIASLTHLNANSLTVSVLPDSIGRLSELVELTLGYNEQLKTLPETICNLRALEVLDIGGCSRLEELPDELGDIESLQKFNANALSVRELPDSIGDLSKLVEMQLRDNKKLETLPDSIDSLISLENLDLRYCGKLSHIPKLPPNLKWIRADGCKSLDTLSEVSDLKQLEYLYLADCSKLTKIQGLADLASLTELHLGGCDSSFLEDTLTEQFFQRQIYSGFWHETKIYIPAAGFPKWITRSSNEESRLSGIDSTVSLDLPSNVSHNFLGMIIGFTHLGVNPPDETTYSIKNTTSGFTWSGNVVSNYHEAQMMIIPTSIFSVKDGDDRIEITANAEILGVHLLHKETL